MKVSSGQNPVLIESTQRKERNARLGQAHAGGAGASASVEVVGQPSMLKLVRLVGEAAEDADPKREAKIEALKRAVQEGSYQVSSRDIADAIIRDTARFHGLE